MTRATWKGALVAALASAGAAWGQSASLPSRPAPPPGRIVTLQEKDSLPEDCRLLKTWTTADGRKAYLLRTLGSEELLTAVQTAGSGAGGKRADVRIYHWANSQKPPEGSPVPPPDGAVRQAAFREPLPEPVKVIAPCPAPSSPPPPPVCTDGGGAKCGKDCVAVHRYEQPPTLAFKPGGCLPVCAPEHGPTWGYYQTQWRPWPGAVAEAPVMTPEH